jgi:hypothetical protein
VGTSLEHLVQCSVANAAEQPDRTAPPHQCMVQAEEPVLNVVMVLTALELPRGRRPFICGEPPKGTELVGEEQGLVSWMQLRGDRSSDPGR